MAEETKKDGQDEAKSNRHDGAGKGETKVTSDVPEKAEGQLNPSSPGDTGTTPGSNAPVG